MSKMKKKYTTPQISVIVLEPQQVLTGTPNNPAQNTKGSFTYDNEIKSGDEDDVWANN